MEIVIGSIFIFILIYCGLKLLYRKDQIPDGLDLTASSPSTLLNTYSYKPRQLSSVILIAFGLIGCVHSGIHALTNERRLKLNFFHLFDISLSPTGATLFYGA